VVGTRGDVDVRRYPGDSTLRLAVHQLMNILDRYLAKAVIIGTLLVLLILVSILAFFNFLGEVARIGTGDYGTADAVEYVLLSMPLVAWEIFPVAALIGTLMALGSLATGSEL